MSDGALIYCIHEKGPNGSAVGFVDLTRLDPSDPVHEAYGKATLDAADQRRRQGFGGATLPHEGMLLLMGEMPSGASIPDSAMPFTIHGYATLEAED